MCTLPLLLMRITSAYVSIRQHTSAYVSISLVEMRRKQAHCRCCSCAKRCVYTFDPTANQWSISRHTAAAAHARSVAFIRSTQLRISGATKDIKRNASIDSQKPHALPPPSFTSLHALHSNANMIEPLCNLPRPAT
jgi:hypothetical protein